MGVKSTVLFAASLVFLIHSAYSAYEFAQFKKHLPVTSQLTTLALPIDIQIEALLGVFLACFASVMAVAGTLKPIKYSEAMTELEAKGENPFLYLETRAVFQDIAAKRMEFLAWSKKN
ncbi:hypothetical protein TRVA0_034S00430 [Trichomonascus vanleenenianus]|uniref:membrane magnesium transporter family protein n=1 Tax=Trichomonascus vanleenenianus TaxID=2268995 RepID=UPI003ECB3A61